MIETLCQRREPAFVASDEDQIKTGLSQAVGIDGTNSRGGAVISAVPSLGCTGESVFLRRRAAIDGQCGAGDEGGFVG
jgi:hypothetical protein